MRHYLQIAAKVKKFSSLPDAPYSRGAFINGCSSSRGVRKNPVGAPKKKNPLAYKQRTYRQSIRCNDLIVSRVRIQETDLHIQADADVTERASNLVLQYRLQLEDYAARVPSFFTSLVPLPRDNLAPPVVSDMLDAALAAGVGPMAAVAGSMACCVGKGLEREGVQDIIVENGGDIYIKSSRECVAAIYAGESPLSSAMGLRIHPEKTPCGVCTSSGTIGHSLSLGKADSVTVAASSAALADAAATRLGNAVIGAQGGRAGVRDALERAKEIEGIDGVVVICDDIFGAFGDMRLVKL